MKPWNELLSAAIAAHGQAEVARRLNLDDSTISLASRGKYPASTDNIEAKVLEVFGGEQTPEIPVGYKQNAVGHLVRIETIKPVDLLRDKLVQDTISQAKVLSQASIDFKKKIEGEIEAFVTLSVEQHGAKVGGKRGNVTLTSFDGRYQVLRAVSDRIDFDEQLLAAKSLIDECLREWTKDGGEEIKTVIEGAFIEDKKGKINKTRILGLQKLHIEDERWQRAMKALSDALTVIGSCTYFRLYERDKKGRYQQIPMDFSAA